MATMRQPPKGKQNGMFSTTHVTHSAYEHMCFQERVSVESSLAFKALERRQNSILWGSGRENRSSSNSPDNAPQEDWKKSLKLKKTPRTSSTRKKAEAMIAAKIRELRLKHGRKGAKRSTSAPTTPSVYETGSDKTHQAEFSERKRHPHRTHLTPTFTLGNGARDSQDSPSPPSLFSPIRVAAEARKAELRQARAAERRSRSREERHRSVSPPIFVANTTIKLGNRIESRMRPDPRLCEIQGFAADPVVALEATANKFPNAWQQNRSRVRPRSASPSRNRNSRSPIGRLSPAPRATAFDIANTRTLNTGIVEHKTHNTWTTKVAEGLRKQTLEQVDGLEDEEARLAQMISDIDMRLASSIDFRFHSQTDSDIANDTVRGS